MGILSDFFIADASTMASYKGGQSFKATDKCQLKGLTPLQAAQFLAVLRGQKYSVEMIREFTLLTPDDAEEWTMLVPQEMVDSLAAIRSDQINHVATQFANATRLELGWTVEDFVSIINELSALGRRAKEAKKNMYLWNSL